jgi:tetratricopeptide (TPR) repeat protein
VAFAGKLGGLNRREAQQLVRRQGGVPVDRVGPAVDLVVIGADVLPLGDEQLLDEPTRQAAARGELEIISETQFWQRLGLLESEQNVRRLYTPAMLADLLGVPVAIVRRWHRRGLIVPAREVHRLPYFDFQEVATAQRLAELLAAGASPAAIEKKLAELARYVPDVERPLAQLSVIVEGQQLLLRQGEGLIEPGGQLRIEFDSVEESSEERADTSVEEASQVVMLADDRPEHLELATPEQMWHRAGELEDAGQLEAAIDMYRALLAAAGPDAEVCFLLAELLYRAGDVTAARERYFNAIELDEDYVEARANLGCVLAETGRPDLAAAAFEGALQYHGDYPDVHYHLAHLLDEIGSFDKAEQHWQEFLALAPDSPWAEEAQARLGVAAE